MKLVVSQQTQWKYAHPCQHWWNLQCQLDSGSSGPLHNPCYNWWHWNRQVNDLKRDHNKRFWVIYLGIDTFSEINIFLSQHDPVFGLPSSDAGLEVEVKDPPKGMIPPGTQMVKPKNEPQPSKVSFSDPELRIRKVLVCKGLLCNWQPRSVWKVTEVLGPKLHCEHVIKWQQGWLAEFSG